MIRSKIGQRIVGVVIVAVSGFFISSTWHTALTTGQYDVAPALLFPSFAIIGVGLMAFPIDVEQFRSDWGVEKPQSFAQLPLSWKVLTVLALIAAFGNWLALSLL